MDRMHSLIESPEGGDSNTGSQHHEFVAVAPPGLAFSLFLKPWANAQG